MSHNSEKWYRLWWSDGQGGQMFKENEIGKMALRYGFDPNDLVLNGCVDFTDGDGDTVGGVTDESEVA